MADLGQTHEHHGILYPQPQYQPLYQLLYQPLYQPQYQPQDQRQHQPHGDVQEMEISTQSDVDKIVIPGSSSAASMVQGLNDDQGHLVNYDRPINLSSSSDLISESPPNQAVVQGFPMQDGDRPQQQHEQPHYQQLTAPQQHQIPFNLFIHCHAPVDFQVFSQVVNKRSTSDRDNQENNKRLTKLEQDVEMLKLSNNNSHNQGVFTSDPHDARQLTSTPPLQTQQSGRRVNQARQPPDVVACDDNGSTASTSCAKLDSPDSGHISPTPSVNGTTAVNKEQMKENKTVYMKLKASKFSRKFVRDTEIKILREALCKQQFSRDEIDCVVKVIRRKMRQQQNKARLRDNNKQTKRKWEEQSRQLEKFKEESRQREEQSTNNEKMRKANDGELQTTE